MNQTFYRVSAYRALNKAPMTGDFMEKGVQKMNCHQRFDDSPAKDCIRVSARVDFEVLGRRWRNGRVEFLSRFRDIENGAKFGYRWRKLCGRYVYIPALKRSAVDGHNTSFQIHCPQTGKVKRLYADQFNNKLEMW